MSALLRIRHLVLLAALPAAMIVCLSPIRVSGDDRASKKTKCPQTILIIRHAEKTGDENDIHLSDQGRRRAEVIEKLFEVSKDRQDPFPKPDYIFAAHVSKKSDRPVETITPFAKKLNLEINSRFDSKPVGATELQKELFGSDKYFGKTILVSWRHNAIPQLAETLGAHNVPTKWNDDVFDRVWQLSYDDQGHVTFRDRPQRLFPTDNEK